MAIEVDSLFQAVDIILEERLKSVSFDTTEICTIVGISDRKNGKYMVSPNNGETKYPAYSESTEYELEDLVRVSIPNGDYTQKKFIEGKYVDDNSIVPITFTSPLNSVIDVTGNLMENQYDTTFGLVSNGGVQTHTLWSVDLTKNARFKDLQASGIYNTISLSAQFKTLLDNYSIRTGSYGLQLDIYTKVSADSTLYTIRTVYLDSSEMFGDPYNFAIYTPQSKKFDLSALNTVVRVVLSFYQKGDFTYYNPKKQTVVVDDETITLEKGTIAIDSRLIKSDNLLVRNVKVGFGSDLSVVADNTLQIYTTNSPDYHLAELEETNEKQIGFLWYNKDENNQYLGFSDGLYDPDYDEIEYIKESSMDYRLLGQKGQEGVPTDKDSLELAADLSESTSYLNNISNLISKDVVRTLNTFKSRVTTVPDWVGKIDTAITEIKESHDILVSKRKAMEDTYAEFLAWNASIQAEKEKRVYLQDKNIIEGNHWNDYEEDDDGNKTYSYPNLFVWKSNPYDLYGSVKTEITNIQGLITQLLTDSKTILNDGFSGFQGIYDTYELRLKKINSSITDYLVALEMVDSENPRMTDNYTVMTTNYPKASYAEYTQKDFSDWANKYCIYWYKYDPDDDGTEYDDFAGPKWKKLLTEKDFNHESKTNKKVVNFGLPIDKNKFETVVVDGKEYYASKSFDTDVMLNQMMCGTRVEEKYKVILFYNHVMYASEELVFTNLDDIPDPTTVDKNDAILISHGDKSQETYQSYGVDNSLINSADANIKRWLKLSYQGLLGGNETLAGAQVYWYVPTNATMLTTNDSDLVSKYKFASDKGLETKPDYSKDGYICYYKLIGSKEITGDDGNPITSADPADLDFYYKIKPYYMQTASQNTILCKVIKGEYTFETDIFIAFNSYGTSGTDYTLAVNPAGAQSAVYAGTPLSLAIGLYDYNNNEIPIFAENPTILEDAQTASGFTAEWVGPTSFDGEENVSVDGDGAITGLTIKNNTDTDDYYGMLKTTVQFSISADNTEADSETATGKESEFKSSRLVNLTTMYPLAYSAGDYYIEGATTVVYDSQGGNPVYYKDPYKIFNIHSNKEMTEELGNNETLSWEIHYYKTGENGEPVEITPKDADYNINMSFMPKLNDAHGLAPSTMYVENIDCYPAVQCWLLERKKKKALLWAQSIVILQNRYPSAMLNSWDGSLTIDEKNGTILSSMVGAGRKTANNTFEGVLMGDIEVGAGIDLTNNKSGLGIYGFYDGAQSFGFNVDGTGFIGKAGRGRILFNGNEGTIASASYYQNHLNRKGSKPSPDTSGMLIDLDDGMIDMRGGANYDAWTDWQGLIKAEYLAKTKAATYKNEIAQATYDKIYAALNVEDIADAYIDSAYKAYNNGEIGTAEIKEIENKIIAMKKEEEALGGIPEFETSFMIEYLEFKNCITEQEKEKIAQIEKYRTAVQEEYQLGRISEEQYFKALNEANYCQFEKYQEYVKRYGDLYRQQEAVTRLQRGDEVSHTLVEDLEQVLKEKEKKLAELQAELAKAEQDLLETDMSKLFTQKEASEGSGGKKPDYILTGDREKLYELLDVLEEEDIIEQEEYDKYLLEKPTQSNVHLNVKAPYFYIVSDQGKRIINIGADTAFDIKSYKKNPNEPSPFQGKGYYLKTNNYMPSTLNRKGEGDIGQGMLIDLAGNKIDAYDFSIKGESSSDYPGSYFSINSSPKKFMDIYYLPDESLRTDSGEGIHLFEMGMKDGEEIYRLRSYDWNLNDENDPHGMEIDFAAGSITIHPGWDICSIDNGGVHSGATQNQSIVIDSNHSSHPFQIGPVVQTVNGEPLRRFRIGWDGSITTPNFTVDKNGYLSATKGEIGGWTIDTNSLSANSTYLRSGSGDTTRAIEINSGTFYVQNNGYMHAQSGSIGGWTIGSNKLGSSTVYLAQTGTVINAGSNFSVSDTGHVTASSINITGSKGTDGAYGSSITSVSIGSCEIDDCTIDSCDITSCTVTDSLTFGSALGGDSEGVAGYSCTVGELDASYYTYGFTSANVVKSVSYTTWNLLGNTNWKIVGSIDVSSATVLQKSYQYKYTRKYQVVKADTIEEEADTEGSEVNTGTAASGGSVSSSSKGDLMFSLLE